MLDTSNRQYLYLTKKHEFLDAACCKIFGMDVIEKELLTSHGTTFLEIMNNIDYILDTLKQSVKLIKDDIHDAIEYIFKKLIGNHHDLCLIIVAEIGLCQELQFDEPSEEIPNVKEYILDLIDSLTLYYDYFCSHVCKKAYDSKSQDVTLTQTLFGINFEIPKCTIYPYYEDDDNINPLNKIPELKTNKVPKDISSLKEKYKIDYMHVYEVNSIKDIINTYFYFFLQENITVMQCSNCGTYFIPANRSNSKYCTNPLPNNPNKTCRDIGATLFYKNSRTPVDIEHNRTKATLSKRISRCLDDKKKLERANNKYNKYIENYAKKEKKYIKGTLSEDEFKEWIIAQKK